MLLLCRNTDKGTCLGIRIRRADNYFKRLIGLLPRTRLDEGEGLWITPCNQIHSMGMRFPFDAVFLSAEGEVVHVMEHIGAFKLSPLVRPAKSVLELPAGTIALTGTIPGDHLVLEPAS